MILDMVFFTINGRYFIVTFLLVSFYLNEFFIIIWVNNYNIMAKIRFLQVQEISFRFGFVYIIKIEDI